MCFYTYTYTFSTFSFFLWTTILLLYNKKSLLINLFHFWICYSKRENRRVIDIIIKSSLGVQYDII